MTPDELAKARRRRYTAIAAIVTSVLLLLVVNLQYINYETRKNDQRWCVLMTTLDAAYASSVPTTVYGRTIASAIHDLRKEFHCDDK
jgi:hypothetical protein